MARHAQEFERPELLRVIHGFNQAAIETRNVWQPSLPLELAFVEAVESTSIEYQSNPTTPPSNPAGEKKASNPIKKPNPTSKKSARGSGDKGVLAQKWSEIFGLVKQASPNTTGLLNASDHELRDGILYLYFNSEMLKGKMEQENHLEALKQALDQVLGAPVEIHCQITGGSQGSLPPGVDGSGLAATAMRLGGEIVDTNRLNKGVGE
jgi:hypothetical protein